MAVLDGWLHLRWACRPAFLVREVSQPPHTNSVCLQSAAGQDTDRKLFPCTLLPDKKLYARLDNLAHLLMLGLLQPQLAHFWVGMRLRKSPATSLRATTVCAVAVPLRNRPPPAGNAAGAVKCYSGCAPASRLALARHISQACWSNGCAAPQFQLQCTPASPAAWHCWGSSQLSWRTQSAAVSSKL